MGYERTSLGRFSLFDHTTLMKKKHLLVQQVSVYTFIWSTLMVTNFVGNSKNWLYEYRNGIAVVFISILATLYSLYGLTSWKFSVVGDEFLFFDNAKLIAEQNLLVNPFALNGVYEQHRVLDSYVPAIFLIVFGSDFAVWKFSSVFMLFPTIIIFYMFVKDLLDKNTAIIAAILLAFSHYLTNFYKIGYPHSFCLMFFVICLYLSARLINYPTMGYAFKLGLSLGIAFYTYIGPLFIVLVSPFFLVMMYRQMIHYSPFYTKRLQALKCFTIVLTVFLLVGMLGFATTPKVFWTKALTKTSLNREFDSNYQFLTNIKNNFILFWKNYYIRCYRHFVEGPYLEFFSRWAAALGIILAIFLRRKGTVLLLILWVVTCVSLGLTNPYKYTPTSRGIFFIPFGAALAAISLNFLRKKIKAFRFTWLVIPAILLVSVAGNIYRAQVGFFRKYGYTRTAIIMREIIANKFVLLFHSPDCFFDNQHVLRLMEYHKIDRFRYAEETIMISPEVRKQRPVLLILSSDPIWHNEKIKEQILKGYEPSNIKRVKGYSP